MGNIQWNNSKILWTPRNKIAFHSDCCCGCDSCLDGTQGDLSVVIAGVSNRDCTDCTDLNNTFVLSPVESGDPIFTWAAENCQWFYDLPSPICGVVQISAVLLAGMFNTLQVHLVYYDGSSYMSAVNWSKYMGTSQQDCSAFSGEVLTRLMSATIFWNYYNSQCMPHNAASTTATVTSI